MNSQKNKKYSKELTVSSSTNNLSEIRNFTETAAAECGFGKEDIGKIILAVDEACTNVIKHAYNYSPEGKITVTAKMQNSKFSITISDKGRSFNPELIPEPNIKEYHAQKRVGGLGMFLMKKLMDDVFYKTLPDKKNQVILIKYLNKN